MCGGGGGEVAIPLVLIPDTHDQFYAGKNTTIKFFIHIPASLYSILSLDYEVQYFVIRTLLDIYS